MDEKKTPDGNETNASATKTLKTEMKKLKVLLMLQGTLKAATKAVNEAEKAEAAKEIAKAAETDADAAVATRATAQATKATARAAATVVTRAAGVLVAEATRAAAEEMAARAAALARIADHAWTLVGVAVNAMEIQATENQTLEEIAKQSAWVAKQAAKETQSPGITDAAARKGVQAAAAAARTATMIMARTTVTLATEGVLGAPRTKMVNRAVILANIADRAAILAGNAAVVAEQATYV